MAGELRAGRGQYRSIRMDRRDLDGLDVMAETSKGNKIVVVPAYDRKQDGKTIHVPRHDRSTPRTSTGKKS